MNTTVEELRKVVNHSGLWDHRGINTHAFLLSPEVFKVFNSQELKELGSALFDCLAGIGRIVTIASNEQLSKGTTWRMIAGLLRNNVPSTHRATQVIKPNSLPVVCKVDLMEDMAGQLFIAEIDGHNRHGFGYATLASKMRNVIQPDAKTFPGVAKTISTYASKRGFDTLTLICPRKDRFYLPEYKILKAELEILGIELELIDENDYTFQSMKRLLIDLPIGLKPALAQQLGQFYLEGGVEFLIPPKPFLSSKFIMALIRNDGNNTELEAILKGHIPNASLVKLRQFIPRTFLIGNGESSGIPGVLEDKKFVLKDFLSSGTKGVYFSDNPNFQRTLDQATNSKKCGYILQEYIENRTQRYKFYPSRNSQHLENDNWYNRIVVHFSRQGVAEVTVTSTREKMVHGGKNCLQLGSVIVN